MTDEPPPLIGTSPAIRRALALIDRYGSSRLSVLVVGRTGTGKEVVARRIHARSGRAGRFVPVNCAALPREMTESLLFGHRRGAFSGALETRRGHVEQADRGTLFLDELLCLPPDSQAKLLRALDTGELQPLGEEIERFVDTRIVAAVQEAVWDNLDTGALRSDLYQRLAGIVIELPPLSQRREDIVPIARHFTASTGRTLEANARFVLECYSWPGNVREVRQVIDRAGRIVENGTLPAAAVAEAISLSHWHRPERPSPSHAVPQSLASAVRAAELKVMTDTLAACGGNCTRAAKRLGISRVTLYRRFRSMWPVSTLQQCETPAFQRREEGERVVP